MRLNTNPSTELRARNQILMTKYRERRLPSCELRATSYENMRYLIIIIITLAIHAAPRAEVKKSAATALPVMDMPLGAKAVAMGEAFSALADDNSAVYWNPAGLRRQIYPRVTLGHNKWFMDASYQELSASLPLRALALGGQFSYVGAGAFERRDEFGARQAGMINPYQFGGALAVARGVGPVSLGVAFKGYRQVIAAYSIAGGAVDLGALCELGETRLSLVVNNLGVATGGYSLPLSFRLGGVRLFHFGAVDLCLSADSKFSGTGASQLHGGGELGLRDVFFFRLGGRLDLANTSLGDFVRPSGGIGLKYDRFLIDYAIAPYGDLGSTHRLSLSFEIRRATLRPEERIVPGLPGPPTRSATTGEQAARPTVDSAVALFEQGLAHEREEDLINAAAKYAASLEIDNTNREAWKRLAHIYYYYRMSDKARTCLQAALRLDPADAEAIKLWRQLSDKQWK